MHRPKHLPFSPLPIFEPGFQFNPHSVWIDRFEVGFHTVEVRARNLRSLKSHLSSIENRFPGVILKKKGNSLALEFDRNKWLFSGQLNFHSILNRPRTIGCTPILRLNLIRYASLHSTPRKRERLSAQGRLMVADVRGGVEELLAKSVAPSDNHFKTPLDSVTHYPSCWVALDQYLSDISQFVSEVLGSYDALDVEIPFEFNNWALRQVEFAWETEELDAVAKSNQIAEELLRASPDATITKYTGEDGRPSTEFVKKPVKNVRLVCYPKQPTRLRFEVRYLKGIRNVLGRSRYSARFPSEQWHQLPEFLREISSDALVRLNRLVSASFPAGGSLGSDALEKFSIAVARIGSLMPGNVDATRKVIRALVRTGYVDRTDGPVAGIIDALVDLGDLERYRPNQRNRRQQYRLSPQLAEAFDAVRKGEFGK